jgi:tRNA A-37 threonylcarbamoyl transferase component Bud32
MLTAGEIFEDKFEILELLGEGSGGMVFKARQQEFHRCVAIKLLKLPLTEEAEARERFLREAKALSTLSHAGIVRFYSYGIWRNAVPYFVMEFIEGTALNVLIRERKTLPEPDVRRWSKQICDALQHAHDQGFIHRDLKPSNVVIDKASNARLFDFGLVRSAAPADGELQRLTQDGSLLGSLCYISPEQCQGSEATAVSDIYSLGCVLYECLSGRPPIAADNPMAAVFRHANQAPEPLAGGMGAAVMKALEKEPDNRFSSAHQFALALSQQKDAVKNAVPSPSRTSLVLLALCVGGLITWFGMHFSHGAQEMASQREGTITAADIPVATIDITDLQQFKPAPEVVFAEPLRIMIHAARNLIRENRRETADEYFEKALAKLSPLAGDSKLNTTIGEIMCERALNLVAAKRWAFAVVKLQALADFGSMHHYRYLAFAALQSCGDCYLRRPIRHRADLARPF